MITLNNIAELIADMKTCQLYRQKFEFKYNQRTVEVMIFIDTSPHEVLVGVFNTRCSFITTISAKGEVKNWIDNYEDLCAALGINYSPIPENRLTPQKFFKMLDSHSPTSALASLNLNPTIDLNTIKTLKNVTKYTFVDSEIITIVVVI